MTEMVMVNKKMTNKVTNQKRLACLANRLHGHVPLMFWI